MFASNATGTATGLIIGLVIVVLVVLLLSRTVRLVQQGFVGRHGLYSSTPEAMRRRRARLRLK